MATIEKGTEVNVPVRTAYDQWTQFEEFPRFMQGVESVTQIDDESLSWRAEIGGVRREWTARITEQIPDHRIAWRADGEVTHGGVVTFHRLTDDSCKVMLQMEFEPQDFVETVGDKLGVISKRVQGDLDRFKEYIESRGVETGAWRGTIEQKEVTGTRGRRKT